MILSPIYFCSLWGALRYNNPLPWDTDFDFCLLHDELSRTDDRKVFQTFKKYGIDIFYRPWFGAYRVTNATARGDLMIFKNFSGVMNRVGFESFAFYVNYEHFHQFPARLIEKPLPEQHFAGITIPVPREGIEIQKYHYPRDWWMESKPKGC